MKKLCLALILAVPVVAMADGSTRTPAQDTPKEQHDWIRNQDPSGNYNAMTDSQTRDQMLKRLEYFSQRPQSRY